MADILSKGRCAPSRQVLVVGAAMFPQGTGAILSRGTLCFHL